MHSVKRLEIVTDAVELTKILQGLKRVNVNHYTVIHNVENHGVWGMSDGDATMIETSFIIAFCTPEQIKAVVETIRPILNKFGGACYVSDAMEVRSLNCVASL
jgi:nitrogen regulatory protein PII